MTWLRRSFPSTVPFMQHQDRREELGPDNGVADDSGSAELVVRHLGHELRQTERGDDDRLLSQPPPRPQSLPRSAGQLRRPWCRPQMADDSAGQARPLGEQRRFACPCPHRHTGTLWRRVRRRCRRIRDGPHHQKHGLHRRGDRVSRRHVLWRPVGIFAVGATVSC